MRLINTTTFRLEQFYGSKIPLYAILSHVWGDQEMSFQDFEALQSNSTPRKRKKQLENTKGYRKIWNACQLAQSHSFEYVWVDTCCINKESSAELSEAINSMYKYYHGSQVCYVYLLDVKRTVDPRSDQEKSLRRSRWFTRGWTLQELLAPTGLVFLDEEWVDMGTKCSLQDVVTAVTGIPYQALIQNDFRTFSTATKMSWAASRVTTREEDLAYCLMGVFGVNMPTLYGEGGPNAFLRLQREIILFSDDQSIFAWTCSYHDGVVDPERGLFARSPSEFIDSGHIQASHPFPDAPNALPFAMTNRGLRIRLPLKPAGLDKQNQFLALLDCQLERGGQKKSVGVYLQREKDQQFVRAMNGDLTITNDSLEAFTLEDVYVTEPTGFSAVLEIAKEEKKYPFLIKILPSLFHSGFAIQEKRSYSLNKTPMTVEDHFPAELDPKLLGCPMFPAFYQTEEWAIIKWQHRQTLEVFGVVFGVRGHHVWTDVVTQFDGQSTKEILESYLSNGRRGAVGVTDSVTGSLQHQKSVTVDIRNAQVEGRSVYEVEVDIVEKIVDIRRLPPPSSYGFAVATETRPSAVIETFPNDVWRDSHPRGFRRKHLSISDKDGWGLLMFKDHEGIQLFAVVLGMRNFVVWVDLVWCLESRDTMETIWTSYRDSGERAQRKQGSSMKRQWQNMFFRVEVEIKENEGLEFGSHIVDVKAALDGRPIWHETGEQRMKEIMKLAEIGAIFRDLGFSDPGKYTRDALTLPQSQMQAMMERDVGNDE
ncbi:hypothetical protein D9758_006731 [Tetrapyrgos nigripes]|uniref:Heterokaryon incompatibility domain-containing protein n=1 Tax=Tetrapyrgos nigripes TaxID=182062 RepID=A0A8H5GJE2_9AGAR|nr:hypothetical protein D9758_006731 [Tetrapyrgos nigripes]